MEVNSLFEEMQRHLLEDEKPSEFIKKAAMMREYHKPPFSVIFSLEKIEQSPKYHPEGNVFNHVLMVVDEAAKIKGESENPAGFMWAALLHDIGKLTTTCLRKGRITSYDHDREGEVMAREFLKKCPVSKEFTDYVCGLVRYHMHILYVNQNLPFKKPEDLVRSVPVKDVALIGLADRCGRTGADLKKEKNEIKQFYDRMMKYS